MKVEAVRRVQFCAGHRVLRHEGKCANPHGHNYVAHLFAEADALDEIGRVVDFSALKSNVGGWIEACWDHGFLYWEADAEVARMLTVAPGWKKYALSANPTAENMAAHLLNEVCPRLLAGTGVRVVRVVLEETENCRVEASL